MLTCYSLVNRFKLRLLFLFISVLIIRCDGADSLVVKKEKNYCPFIEELSFGSDIDIKCNNTYLIYNEINNKKLNWKFANKSFFCHQEGKVETFVNECNITRIDSKYLKVPLKSLYRNEYACVYCPINYKPIAPIVIVTRHSIDQHDFYTFNLTATGLDQNESFEILWAKRVNHQIKHSVVYWFLQRCINDYITNILENIGHTIIFDVTDVDINRVEFIIRRCSSTCRTYQKCNEEEFSDETSLNNLQRPASIEKISCNYDCLNGIVSTTTTITTTTTTMNNIKKEDALLSPIQLSNEKPKLKFLILFPILGLLIVLLFIILGCFIISRIKGLRTSNVYTKTSNINLDQKEANVE